MKKIFLMLITFLMFAGTVIAEERSLPAVGDVLNGFKVTELYEMQSFETTVVHMEHEKTGAKLLWLANDEINYSFQIDFRTPIRNDMGVPHVFEHAVLAGSEKYPSPNLFFAMSNQSYNTFLNAMTARNETMFPMASLSQDQLAMFIDYYMNGVFHPTVVTDKRAMMREAFHYELEEPEGEITTVGTVYNEMQGAYSLSRDTFVQTVKRLFPGSYVVSETGGHPSEIPNLTHQDLIDFHTAYYHPSNSLMILTGDLDIDRFTKQLNEDFLADFSRKEIVIDESYEDVTGHFDEVVSFPAELGSAEKNASIIIYAIPLKGMTLEAYPMLAYLAAYMSDESQPFRKAMKEKLPAVEGSVSFFGLGETPEPALYFEADNANAEDRAVFKEICDEAIKAMLAEEIDTEILDYLVKSNIYSRITSNDDASLSFNYALDEISNVWASCEGNVNAYQVLDAYEVNVEENVTPEALKAFAEEWLSEIGTSLLLTDVPVPGLAEEKAAEEAQRLADMKARMTPEEIQALVDETKDFHAWSEANAAMATGVDAVKAVGVAELPEDIQTVEVKDMEEDGLRIVTSEMETPLVMANLYFNAESIPADLLRDYAVYASLVGSLSTETYDRTELDKKTASVLFTRSFSADSIKFDEGGFQPVYHVSFRCLDEDLERAFAMMKDMLFTTDFSDYDYIRNQAAQVVAQLPLIGANSGVDIAWNEMKAVLNPDLQYDEALYGDPYYETLQKIASATDAEMDAMVERFARIQEYLLNRNGLILTVVGNEGAIQKAASLTKDLMKELNTEVNTPADLEGVYQVKGQRIAFPINGTIHFNFAGVNPKTLGFESVAQMKAFASMVQDRFLIPELRYNRGAYGAYMVTGKQAAALYTYRDPNLSESYEYYSQVADLVRNTEITQDELDGYIISVYSEYAMPDGPLTLANTAVNAALTHQDVFGEQARSMKDLKAFTVNDLPKYYPILDAIAADDSLKVTAGPKSSIEASGDFFDAVDPIYMGLNSDEKSILDMSPEEIGEMVEALSKEELAAYFAQYSEEELENQVSDFLDSIADALSEEDQMILEEVFASVIEA